MDSVTGTLTVRDPVLPSSTEMLPMVMVGGQASSLVTVTVPVPVPTVALSTETRSTVKVSSSSGTTSPTTDTVIVLLVSAPEKVRSPVCVT